MKFSKDSRLLTRAFCLACSKIWPAVLHEICLHGYQMTCVGSLFLWWRNVEWTLIYERHRKLFLHTSHSLIHILDSSILDPNLQIYIPSSQLLPWFQIWNWESRLSNLKILVLNSYNTCSSFEHNNVVSSSMWWEILSIQFDVSTATTSSPSFIITGFTSDDNHLGFT